MHNIAADGDVERATMAVVSLKGFLVLHSQGSTAADGNNSLVCRHSRMMLEKRSS